MKPQEITGNETADELVKMLAHLRLLEALSQKGARQLRQLLANLKKMADESSRGALARALVADYDEWLLNRRFDEVSAGQFLIELCTEMDAKGVSREAIFDVINTNRADRFSEDVKMHGDKSIALIAALGLENSASIRGSDYVDEAMQPLRWCFQQALFNALATNPKLEKTVHDEANRLFNGAFGEYRERPLMATLIGGVA